MPRFSDTVMAHFEAPSNRGRLEHPDGVGLVGTPGAGAFFLLGLHVAGGRVTAARFECHGCGAFVACGSVLTELVIGRDVASCKAITQLELVEALDGLTPDKQHCLDTALHALPPSSGGSGWWRRSGMSEALPHPCNTTTAPATMLNWLFSRSSHI